MSPEKGRKRKTVIERYAERLQKQKDALEKHVTEQKTRGIDAPDPKDSEHPTAQKEDRDLKTKKERHAERLQKQKDALEKHVNEQKTKGVDEGPVDDEGEKGGDSGREVDGKGGNEIDPAPESAEENVENADEQPADDKEGGGDLDQETLDVEKGGDAVESALEDTQEGAVEVYADATLRLQNMLKEKFKDPDTFRKRLDEHLDAYRKDDKRIDFDDPANIRKLFGDILMTCKGTGMEISLWHFTDENTDDVVDYLRTKNTYLDVTDKNLVAVQEEMTKENSEGDVEKALDAIQMLENGLADEEVRLRENLKGGSEWIKKAKNGWKWLGDKNLAQFLSDRGLRLPTDKRWGKIGYSVLRSASLRTILMGALVPVGGFGFGAAGITTALGLRTGVRALYGASSGYAFTREWYKRGLKKKVGAMPALGDFKEKDYESVIDIKKEYDAFIQQHRLDVADEMRGEDAYKDIQTLYREAVKHFCEGTADTEKLRTKQNLAEVRARNIVKKNRTKMFVGAGLGAATSSLAVPFATDVVSDAVSGWFGGSDVSTSADTDQNSNTDKKSSPPSTEEHDPENLNRLSPDLESDTETQRLPLSRQKGGFTVKHEDDGTTPLPETLNTVETASASETDTTDGEVAPENSDDGGFEVDDQGVYTVQDGNWLSEIWLDKNGGDAEQMKDVMEALRGLQGTKEGDAMLREEFGILSGDIDKIYPGDRIDTKAIQDWFGGETSGASDGTEGAETASQTPENRVATEEESASEQGAADASGAETPTNASPSLNTTTYTADSNTTVADILQSHGLDASTVPPDTLDQHISAGQSVEVSTTEEGGFAGITVDGESALPDYGIDESEDVVRLATSEPDADISVAEDESLPDLGVLDQTTHTVQDGERTVADVLRSPAVSKSHKFTIDAVPEGLLKKQVFEGHDVQLFSTAEGDDLTGIIVDGQYFSLEQSTTSPLDTRATTGPKMSANEAPPLTDNLKMSAGESLSFTDSLRDLVKTVETLNEDMRGPSNHEHIVIARSDGVPILPITELQEYRPDLFESDQDISSTIVRGDNEVLIQVDNPPQKRFLIETNKKGVLNHGYVQEEFDTIEKTLKKPAAIRSARQGVIKKAIASLTVEKPPADIALFDTLSDRLSSKIEDDANLTERMFSEKGWRESKIRVAYSENQKYLEVQERFNTDGRWKWQPVLVEKIAAKK